MTPAPERDLRLAKWLGRILNEARMGFLALLSLFLGLVPSVFNLGAGGLDLVGTAEVCIIGLFAVEYIAGLLRAPSRQKFVINPWRILDACIILVGVLSLTSAVNNLLRNTPVLRLFRLSRLALFGTRFSTSLIVKESAPNIIASGSEVAPQAFAVVARETFQLESVPWTEALDRMHSLNEDWLLVSHVTEVQLSQVAEALGVPEAILRTRFFDSVFPRVDRMDDFTAIFAWYPILKESGESGIPAVNRAGVLLVGSMNNVVVLSREPIELPKEIGQRLEEAGPNVPPLVRGTFAMLKVILRRYARINEALERALIDIEFKQAQLNDRNFLDRTFRLRGEITRVRSSLKHLADVLSRLAEKPVAIKGFENTPRPQFALLADDAENLYESVDDHLETLGALVDLRLNVSSFQMNKVMRLLAILTALALVPAVAGGLMGMNLSDNPWPPTLSQVTFGVAAGMALSLYIFAVKGWLR